MNDERLIQLLRETPPEELSRDEISELRRRLPSSSELRQALFEHLQLDQALCETLGGLSLSPESIARRAADVPPGGAGRLFGWGTISAVLLGLIGVGVLVALRREPAPPAVVAARTAAAPAKKGAAPQTPSARGANGRAAQREIQSVAEDGAGEANQDESTQPVASDVHDRDVKAAPVVQPPDDHKENASRWFDSVIAVNNEAYNGVAELAVALRHQQWRDASRVIAAVQPADMAGLAPDAADGDLLATMEIFVEEAIHAHAELRQAIEDECGDAAWQRFRQAADEDDADAVAAVSLKFAGTAAAQEARRWLGDRALAAGRFCQALGHYRVAVRDAEGEPNGSLAARVRLAGAMLGQDLGTPPAESIEFNGEQLDPAGFENLVTEMRSRAQLGADDRGRPLAPPPGSYAARVVARFSGPQVPSADRPIGLAHATNALIVSDGYNVSAFDPADGHRRWSFSLTEPAKAAASPAEPMAPLVVGAAIYVRLLGAGGPELVSLSIDAGQPIWRDHSPLRLVCEPLLIDDQLVAAVCEDDVAGRRRIDLVSLDPTTGHVAQRRRLAWISGQAPRCPCTMTAMEDLLVVATGDILMATDLHGRLRWVRRQATPDAPPGKDQSPALPLLCAAGDSVYHCRSGEGVVQCIDVGTGRRRWVRPIGPQPQMILVAARSLLVQMEDTIDAFDSESGEPRWHVPAALPSTSAALAANETAIVLAESAASARPRLRWVNIETGEQIAECALDGLAPNSRPVAQWSAAKQGFWTAHRDTAANAIELIELRSK